MVFIKIKILYDLENTFSFGFPRTMGFFDFHLSSGHRNLGEITHAGGVSSKVMRSELISIGYAEGQVHSYQVKAGPVLASSHISGRQF